MKECVHNVMFVSKDKRQVKVWKFAWLGAAKAMAVTLKELDIDGYVYLIEDVEADQKADIDDYITEM